MPVQISAEQNNEPGIRFAKRSFLLIASNLLKLFVQLSILFLYSRQLSIEAYGLYQSVWLYVNVTSIIALFGLPAIILSTSLHNVVSWIRNNQKSFYLVALLLNLLPLCWLLFGAAHYDTPTRLLLIALTLVQNVSIIAETIAIKNEKETRVLIVNIIFSTAYLLCHMLVLKEYALPSLLMWLIAAFILKSILLWNFSGTHKIQAEQQHSNIKKQWAYLGLSDIVGVLFKWIDKWVILLFVSLSQFAIYFNGAYEIPVFVLMISAVGNIMLVELSRQKFINVAKTRLLFRKSSMLLASIVFPSFGFLLFYHEEFFTLIFSSRYQESIPIFLVSIFVLPVRITNFTAALQVYNRNDLVLKGAVLDLLLALCLMAILYPLFKLPGLSLAFVISTYLQAAYYLLHTSRLLKTNIGYFFPFRKLILLMISSLIIMGVGYYVSSQFTYPSNLIAGMIICVLLIGKLLSWYFKVEGKLIGD